MTHDIAGEPYGYRVTFEYAERNGGLLPTYATKAIERKGTEKAARKAAKLYPGFREIVSVEPIAADQAPAPRQKRVPAPAPAPAPIIPKPPSPAEVDAAADAIRTVNAAAAALAAIARTKREMLEKIEVNVRTIQSLVTEPDTSRDLERLTSRISRLREFINMEELESWQITVNRVMAASWERLR